MRPVPPPPLVNVSKPPYTYDTHDNTPPLDEFPICSPSLDNTEERKLNGERCVYFEIFRPGLFKTTAIISYQVDCFASPTFSKKSAQNMNQTDVCHNTHADNSPSRTKFLCDLFDNTESVSAERCVYVERSR